VIGLRDKAVLGVLAYTGARVGAVAKLRVVDYRDLGSQKVLRFQEKNGKDRDYEIVIPFGTPVRASVASPGFQVSNLDTNATVDTLRGTGEPLTVGRGAAQRTLRYRINGFTPTPGAPIN
jgi:integrase